jgi:NADH-quinone oxidoreductase subunit H
VILALQQQYSYQDAWTIWEALRVWLNTEPIPGWRFTPFWSNAIMLLTALVFIFLLELLLTIGIQIWERRVLGRMQSRLGPRALGNLNPTGMRKVAVPILILLAIPALAYGVEYWTAFSWPGRSLGVIITACTFLAFGVYAVYFFGYYWRQGFADAIKLFFKEDVVPLNADRFLFTLAPILVYLPALLSWIVIPFGVAVIGGHYCYYIVQDLNVGLLLIIADFALFLVAIIMSGYASNNKYALAGAMREAAMLLTYEVPMLMSLLCVALFAGSLNLAEIVERQSMTWAILPLLPAFVIYFVISLAETNRPPFDLPEAQNELLGGYLVEYSGLRFALFYVAEYSNVFIVSAIMATCFLGGWKGPMFLGYDGLWLSSLFWFLFKTYLIVYFFIWARATMPRIRIDQIMFFSWKFLLPASVVALGITAMGVAYRHPWFSANRIWDQASFSYQTVTTQEALTMLTAGERAFFWGYTALTVLFTLFVLWLAWRVLFARRKHPLPRREVTWGA